MWTTLAIGKHKGKSLPQIILSDPDYFYWAAEQENFFRGRLAAEAKKLLIRAERIKIPKKNPDDWSVEYVFTPEGRFARFQIVHADQPDHLGSSLTSRSPYLSFSVVRASKHYDKLGYKLFLRSFKFHYFGDESARLTQAKCDAFFDDLDNFMVGGFA